MRGDPSRFRMITPKDLGAALQLIGDSAEDWRPFAGGTDIMVKFESGLLLPTNYCNINNLPDLHGVSSSKDRIRIGATTTFSEIIEDRTIAEEFPMLAKAGQCIGARAIRNRATIGGNVMNASPAADSPPVLLVYDAELVFRSLSAERTIAYRDFHTGYKKTANRPDELLIAVDLPRPNEWDKQYFRKVGTRKAQAISKVVFASVAKVSNNGVIEDIRLAIGSVAPTVLRLTKTEKLLTNKVWGEIDLGQAKAVMESEIQPIDDLRSSADYRRTIAVNLLKEFLGS